MSSVSPYASIGETFNEFRPEGCPDPSLDPNRDERGRFRPKNAMGMGNPHARQVAQLRKAFLYQSQQHMEKIAKKMCELAEEGNVQAAKLVMAYSLGKPLSEPHPDQLDLQEWEIHKGTCRFLEGLGPMASHPTPDGPLEALRTNRKVLGMAMLDDYWTKFHSKPSGNDPEPEKGKKSRTSKGRKGRRKSSGGNNSSAGAPGGKSGHGVSSNGNNSPPSPTVNSEKPGEKGPREAETISILDFITKKNE